jgi:hypothetical protein
VRAARAPAPGAIAGALALALLACLSKESGVAVPLLVALAWAGAARREHDPRVARRLRLGTALAAALAAGYVAFLLLCGYGTRSAFYLVPWSDPAGYAARLAQLVPSAALSAFGPFPIDLAASRPGWLVPWVAFAALAGSALLAASWRSARDLAARPFLAAWALLAILPQAGAHPSDRLLFLPMVGLAPLVAALAARGLRGPWRERGVLGALVALLALPLSGALLLFAGISFGRFAAAVRAAQVSAEVPRDGSRCDAFLLQSGSAFDALAPDPTWIVETGLDSVRFHALQTGRRGLRLRGIDRRTFEVETLAEPFLTQPFERVFLSPGDHLGAGTRRRAAGFEVEVLRAGERGPLALRLVLDEPASSGRWRFLAWRERAFRRIDLPPPGETLELAACEPLDPLFP